MVFHATSLPQDFQYKFKKEHQELFIDVGRDTKINGLLFKTENTKGLVFYLHGNAGTLKSWGTIADFYVDNGYDFFIMDYRSFGKSTGVIKKEEDMYQDVQVVFDSLMTLYDERNTIVIGYSIGTGFAAKLASENKPKKLILKAPYYSLPNLVNQSLLIIPHFMVKYKLSTYKFLKNVTCSVTIFHGDADKVIPIRSSYKLKKKFKEDDELIVIEGLAHRGVGNAEVYRKRMTEILK
jgi:uncharacterized protein